VRAVPQCPIRPGQPCTLCQIDVTGPQDCGLVYLVMTDDELRRGVRSQRNQRSASTRHSERARHEDAVRV
jgi:hypothetical protein